jgi:beta-lactamase superfamily II metal-dependent hydrolase
MAIKPNKIELYAYNVYFGDCFLMLFKYPDNTQKSVLIDFGSTGKGKHKKEGVAGIEIDESDEMTKDTTGERLLKVAKDIQEKCQRKLDVVVATHRHKDHIYGFGLKEAGKIILDCKPTVVIQPWTEDPEDNRDLTEKRSLVNPDEFKLNATRNFALMLHDMNRVAESIEAEAENLGNKNNYTKTIDEKLKERIIFTANDNKIKNRAAVDNLAKMGDPHYVHFGYGKIEWETLLPGVKVHILGPPTLEDSEKITSAATKSDEFWSLQAMTKNFWGVQAATSRVAKNEGEDKELLFSKNKVHDDKHRPANVRWFIRQLRALRANQLLEIVKFVDDAMNNTSVIMLFEAGNEKLLFPGDAQIENWQFALDAAKKDPLLQKLLNDTTVYKVGHHGSRNATPKSLWNGFKNKSEDKNKSGRLKTVNSTMEGKHGESEDTAVPLPKMVKEMKSQSQYHSTEEIEESFFDLIEIELG